MKKRPSLKKWGLKKSPSYPFSDIPNDKYYMALLPVGISEKGVLKMPIC